MSRIRLIVFKSSGVLLLPNDTKKLQEKLNTKELDVLDKVSVFKNEPNSDYYQLLDNLTIESYIKLGEQYYKPTRKPQQKELDEWDFWVKRINN